ncbi:SGNH/GDSL hydrolase family protein [Catenuloplanes niger]|uniref:Lysophospholipase L1-like esterase n=1 Tax=Catenuloplanes niger TaxID=587534 RepID=A0AAE4A0A6_9ACTN|nr:SGNH/GDSL hydrolase family protein [Catenuloplanes niger]MDR7326850.1 lysophospholipase L1-like esterase [Catenuloplanes niger]
MTAVLAVTATVAAATPAQATGLTPGDYVALGDSFASGVGAPPYLESSGACLRSEDSYPRTWARIHSDFTLRDMTCSGATIADVRAGQMGALGARTTLVTITVGGNDDGFTNTVRTCLTGTDADCKAATDLAAHYARTTLADDLAALYTDIRARAPHARVLVLGYPRLVAEGTGSCGAVGLSAAKRQQVTHNADHLAAGIADAAGRAGVRFVEMRLPFLGHEACTTPMKNEWIHGVSADVTKHVQIFHPKRYGHAVVYAYMLSAEISKL